MSTYHYEEDRSGGILITRSRNGIDEAEVYLQPGDDANSLRPDLEAAEKLPDGRREKVIQSLLDQYDDVMRPVQQKQPELGDLVRFIPNKENVITDPDFTPGNGATYSGPFSGRVTEKLSTAGGDYRYQLRAESGPNKGAVARAYGRDGVFESIGLEQAYGFESNRQIEKPPLEKVAMWLSLSQRMATEQAVAGEDGQFFRDKMAELAGIIDKMPKTYETDGLPDAQKPVSLRYFGPGGSQWFIIEKDRGDPETDGPHGPRQLQAFGLADLGQGFPEMGYINIEEITRNPLVQLDYHFEPTNLLEIKKSHYPELIRPDPEEQALTGPDKVAAVEEGKKQREADIARNRLAAAYKKLDGVRVQIDEPAHGGVVTVSGQEYLHIKVSHGTDHVYAEKQGAAVAYRLRNLETDVTNGVKAKEFNEFAKATLAIAPDGDVRKALRHIGIVSADKALSDFLRERQRVRHHEHPSYSGLGDSLANAEDFERRTALQDKAKARDWAKELRERTELYGKVAGLSPDSVRALAGRLEKSVEQAVSRPQIKRPKQDLGNEIKSGKGIGD